MTDERKNEFVSKITEAKTQEELAEIRTEIEQEQETPEEKTEEISHEEERSLMVETHESEPAGLHKIEMEESKMERKLVLDSVEYRNAWAKKLMGLSEDKFTEDEKRALGDAVTTTATTFVPAAADTQGINNGGLFIPTTVRAELMEIIEEMSPIFRDIRKLQVAGNIDMPYLDEADDANWYTELNDTVNEGAEYRNMQLTGWELAKDVVITWKLEEMAVDSFISFLLEELAEKMGRALITAVIYGDGINKPTGITNGLTPVIEGETPIDCIINTYKALSQKARIGAKAYISTDVNIEIVGYQDNNGNYPFLQGLEKTKLVTIEQDPFLVNNDIVVGNCKKYILNEVTPLRVEKERTVKGRKTIFGGYAIYDGKPRPGYFAYGKYDEGASI